MSTSPVERSLQLLRHEGYIAEVVERRLPRCFITRDFLGCIDIIGCKSGSPILGIQATTGANAAARRTKALALPGLRVWLEAGGAFAVWAWSLRGARGQREVWTCRRQALTLADLPQRR